MRREFYPEVDGGAFEMYVRAPSGTRIERTEEKVALLEEFIKKTIPEHDLELYRLRDRRQRRLVGRLHPQRGPDGRRHQGPAQGASHASRPRNTCTSSVPAWPRTRGSSDMDFGFDAGGLVRGAMNEGKSTPINIRVTGKNQRTARAIAEQIRAECVKIDGIVDARIIQRLDYPEYVIDVNRAKAADLGLTQEDVMKNVVAAFNSSIQFNKRNFWIDPIGGNQYFVGVQYPEGDIKSIETLLNIPITSKDQKKAIPLSQPDHAPTHDRADRGDPRQHPADHRPRRWASTAETSATSPTT